MDRHKEATETKEKEKMKWLYNITDNIDIYIQRKLKKFPKQASYEWYQDNIPHKLGDERIGAALGVNKKADKKDETKKGKIHRPKRRKKRTVVRGMADKRGRR